MELLTEALERLGPENLRAVVVGYRDALRAHREALNRLNVYPVPDGDTGTNMASTLDAVVAELGGATGMAAVCKAISHGSLMGARGNSGVILSQILRGLTEHLKAPHSDGGDSDGADAATVADALQHASTAAYQAVMRPVEGTMLTVVREAAEAAGACRHQTLVDVLDAAGAAAHAAVARTPELLAVLAEAGVVDAGGAGLALLFDVALHVVAGRPVPEPDADPDPDSQPFLSRFSPSDVGKRDKNAEGEEAGAGASDAGPRYEVMFLLEAGDEAVAAMKEAWAALGDSIVVVGGDGTWSCHVHADDVGAAVEAGIEAGRPHRIRVTDLHEQVAEEDCLRNPPGDDATVVTAVVAVAAGDGVARILRSLGAHRVVPGGQAMNPSTAELLDAVEAAPGKEVVVLPNNKNVAAVAEQAAKVSTKPVRVVGTVTVPQGFAALLAHDPDADAETNLAAMAEAVERVVSGEVTRAVRDAATTPAGPVRSGDWLGVTPGGIEVVDAGVVGAVCALLDRLVGEHHEIVTLVEGEEASPDDTRLIIEWLAQHRSHVAVESHQGGQPLAAYLLSAE